MTELEVAYIAGLFDGEGDARVAPYKSSKNGAYYDRLYARISNTDEAVLDWVRATAGYGSVYTKGIGKHSVKECFAFQVSNANAKIFLTRMLPYLHIKKARVMALLSGKKSGRTVMMVLPAGLEPASPG